MQSLITNPVTRSLRKRRVAFFFFRFFFFRDCHIIVVHVLEFVSKNVK